MGEIFDIRVPLEQEGTKAVVRNWLKQPGDAVAVDDPLVELETDKVTQEIPAPVAGIFEEPVLHSGENAEPGAILGRIRLAATTSAPIPEEDRPGDTASAVAAPDIMRYSPAVRRAALQYGIDPATVPGSGKGGRVTRMDMEMAFANRKTDTPSPIPPSETKPIRAEAGSLPEAKPASPASGTASRTVLHTPMRLAIAEHMAASVATAPHVTAVFEADFSAVMKHREKHKAKLAAEGISLSYTAYIICACVAAMRHVPDINSRWHADHLEIFDDINIGVGTALGDKGLIVPVIRQAQHLSLSGIAARLQDLTSRARNGTLGANDVRGGTFTISNHGVSGSLLASPIIINQPQSAILGVGKLEKRVVVREIDGADTLQIRPMAYVSLTIDHRAVDGHQTNAWLTRFVETLENWPQ